MRFTVNIDCTPEEARSFFGAPNVAPMQEALMQQMQQQFSQGMQLMDPAEAMRQWSAMSLKAFGDFQNMLWSGVKALPTASDTPEKQTQRG